MGKFGIIARSLLGWSLSLGVVVGTSSASAKADASSSTNKSDRKKIVVGAFDGPKSDQIRKAVIAALRADGTYDVTDSTSVNPGDDDKTYARAAGSSASVVLVGTVKKGSSLVISVHNGADGSLIQDVDIKGKSTANLRKSINATLVASLADSISQGKVEAAASADTSNAVSNQTDSDSKKTDESEPTASEPGPEPDADAGPSPLDLQAGLRAVHRSFDYHDTPSQLFPQRGFPAPLTYQLPLGPAVFIDGIIYPLAFAGRGAAANIGLAAGYEANFATTSVYDEGKPDAVNLTTRASQYYLGLRGRLPVKQQEFGLVAAYGQQNFTLAGDERNALIPDVTYQFIKVSADARLKFDDLTLGFHVGTRIVMNTGGLQEYWFPHTKTQSIEAGLLLGYAIGRHLDLITGVDLTRYAFDFNPIPNNADPNSQAIAGGAVDQYVSGYLGIRYQLPNSSKN